MKKAKKSVKLAYIAIIILIIIGLALIIFLVVKNKMYSNKQDLRDDEKETIEPVIYNNEKYNTIILGENTLIGTWKGISEEIMSRNFSLENSSITFNSDSSYILVSNDEKTQGYYKIVEDKVYFYYNEEYFKKNSSDYYAWVSIKDNKLSLIYPSFPKVVVYEKA